MVKKDILTKEKELATVATPKVEVQVDTVSFEDMVDAYGVLAKEVAAIIPDPRIAELAKLEKSIVANAAIQLEKDEGAEITGMYYTGTIGACAKKPRTIGDLGKFREAVGDEVFMKLAKVSISDIEKYCNPTQVAEILSQDVEYTDRRTLTVKPIA